MNATATAEISQQTQDAIVATFLRNANLGAVEKLIGGMTNEECKEIRAAVARHHNRQQ